MALQMYLSVSDSQQRNFAQVIFPVFDSSIYELNIKMIFHLCFQIGLLWACVEFGLYSQGI